MINGIPVFTGADWILSNVFIQLLCVEKVFSENIGVL